MSVLATVLIAIAAGLIGFFVGVVSSTQLNMTLEEELKAQENNLKYAPMVIECNLGQPLTLDQMIELLGPNFAAIRRKLGNGVQSLPPLRETAETILQWYNPESGYTKLVLVGYMRGGLARLAWTWQKQDTKNYIMTQDAVEGLEKYYEDALGNPMILGNQEG